MLIILSIVILSIDLFRFERAAFGQTWFERWILEELDLGRSIVEMCSLSVYKLPESRKMDVLHVVAENAGLG